MVTDILINGLVVSGLYAMLAVGFALIFGVAKIVNMAHTAFFMLGAFFVLIGISTFKIPTFPAIIIAIFIVSVFGIIVYNVLFDRIKHHETAVMIISVALAMLLQEIMLLIFGGGYRGMAPFVQGYVTIFGSRVLYQHLIAIGSSAIVFLVLWLILMKTRLGNAIRAVAEDQEIANLMGINVSRIFTIVMGMSVALAGLAGAIIAPIYSVSPMMWMHPLTIILAAVVLGGLGSVGGSAVGALILGYTETLVTFLIPGGAFLRGGISLIIMVIVLIVRPEGLFGIAFEEERL